VTRGRNKHVYPSGRHEHMEKMVNIGIIEAVEYLYIPFIAKKLREQGYHVRITVYKEGLTLTRHLAEGLIDLGYSPLITQLIYYRFNPSYKIIYGGVYGGAGVIVNNRSNTSQGGSTPISTMEACLKTYDRGMPVKYYYGGDEILKALSRGEIKAAAIWEPYLTQAIKLGFKLESSCSDLIAPYCCTLAANKSFLEEMPNIKQLVEKSMEDYRRDPLRMVSWYSRLVRTPVSLIKKIYKSYNPSWEIEKSEVYRMLVRTGVELPSPGMMLEAIET
jgi:predicted transcriptional regulator